MKKSFAAFVLLMLGSAAPALAANGTFCSGQNEIIEWVCNEAANGSGWVKMPNGCSHRNTQTPCDEDAKTFEAQCMCAPNGDPRANPQPYSVGFGLSPAKALAEAKKACKSFNEPGTWDNYKPIRCWNK